MIPSMTILSKLYDSVDYVYMGCLLHFVLKHLLQCKAPSWPTVEKVRPGGFPDSTLYRAAPPLECEISVGLSSARWLNSSLNFSSSEYMIDVKVSRLKWIPHSKHCQQTCKTGHDTAYGDRKPGYAIDAVVYEMQMLQCKMMRLSL